MSVTNCWFLRMKFKAFAAATFCFLVLLLGIYYIHVRYFKVDVVFYAALSDALMSVLLTGLILLRASIFKCFTSFEKLQQLLIFGLAGYALAISVPTVIDRSLSFYLLEKIDQRGGGIRHEAFERIFQNEYMKEHRLVDVRLTEQLESGTIVIEDGCVRLTDKGKRISAFSLFFRHHLLPKQRLLMGEYSDDLTNPFRLSNTEVDYSC